MNTYPEMDAKIVGILRLGDEPAHLYAAQRIEELEGALDEARRANERRAGEIERLTHLIIRGVDLTAMLDDDAISDDTLRNDLGDWENEARDVEIDHLVAQMALAVVPPPATEDAGGTR